MPDDMHVALNIGAQYWQLFAAETAYRTISDSEGGRLDFKKISSSAPHRPFSTFGALASTFSRLGTKGMLRAR